NTGAGVKVDTGIGNTILGNSIFNNGQGIVLVNNGNNNQLPPTIQGVNSAGGRTTIQGQLTGFAINAAFVLEFFSSAPGDNLAVPGQAHVFLGSTQIVTDGTGFASYLVSFPTGVPAGQVVTATAASASGDTSSFATAQALAGAFTVTTTADNGNNSNAIV